jgi:hypothetical protein
VSEDVTLTNNLVRRAGGGLSLAGAGWLHPQTDYTKRVRVANNLFTEIDGARWGGSGRFLLLNGRVEDARFEHNTALAPGGTLMFSSPHPTARFTLLDNVLERGAYGILGDGSLVPAAPVEGENTLRVYAPGYTVRGNVFIGADAGRYPEGNFGAPPSSVRFVDPASSDYRLGRGSPYRGKATDGKDPGVDLEALRAALRGVVTAGADPLAPAATLPHGATPPSTP